MRTVKPLVFLLLAMAGAGCEKPEFIDFDTTPPEERFDAERDTVEIDITTATQDSIEVWNPLLEPNRRGYSIEYLGAFNDPVFGITRASVVTQVELPENNLNFGPSPQADSVVFVIRFSGAFYGNISTPQTIEVYEVTERLFPDLYYYTSSDISVGATPLATWTGTLNPADTTIRITLSSAFATKMVTGSSTDYASNTNFKNYINGLCFKPVSQGLAVGEGALVTTNLSASLSRLIVYYSNNNANNLAEEFPVIASTVRLTLTEHDYTGTEIETQLQNPMGQYEKAFLQPLGGVKVHMGIPGLQNFATANPDLVIIHRARLVIPRHTANPGDTLAPPTSLNMLISNADTSNNYREFIADRSLPANFGGTYNSATREYVFNITRYFQQEYQKILNDPNYRNTGLNLIVPSNFAERLVINSSNTSQGTPVMLEIIYSKVD